MNDIFSTSKSAEEAQWEAEQLAKRKSARDDHSDEGGTDDHGDG